MRAATPSRLGVRAPHGYRTGAAAAHVRDDGDSSRLDVALIVSEPPAIAAGVFTKNRLKAAPVLVSQLALQRSTPVSAVVVNAGNANACTGDRGVRDALRMCSAVAEALLIDVRGVLVCSTGVIGRPLPIDRVTTGIRAAAALEDDSGMLVAQAIMTTDTRPKHAVRTFSTDGVRYAVGGVAKGAGMLHPDMATLLALLTCDVRVPPALLQDMVRGAADETFNCLTVDGDTSPNDTVLLLANGAAGGPLCEEGSPLHHAFGAAVRAVCADLAIQLMADAEGAQRYFHVVVHGAESDRDARTAARTVAASPLVKTAVHGGDPNWGRIVAALGRSGAAFVLHRCSVSVGGHTVLRDGVPELVDFTALGDALRRQRIEIDIRLGDGPGTGHSWGCELSADYVRINAEYTT